MTNKPKLSLETKKVMTVLHFRFAMLFLGLLLSLLAIAIAHKEVAFNSNYKSIESVKELSGVTKTFHLSDSKLLKGRKIGVKNTVTKEEASTVKDMKSSRNFAHSPNEEEITGNTRRWLSEDKHQNMEPQKLLEATVEIYKMLNKDYHQKPHRRPPINNHVPLKDQNKESTP